MVEKFSGQEWSMGIYTKMEGVKKNDRNVYANKDGSQFLYMYGYGWGSGGNIESNSVAIRTSVSFQFQVLIDLICFLAVHRLLSN